jgi:hypothetical protein
MGAERARQEAGGLTSLVIPDVGILDRPAGLLINPARQVTGIKFLAEISCPVLRSMT